MLQKVTFVAHYIVDLPHGMSIVGAKRNVKQALAVGDQGQDYGLHFKRLIKLEIMEEES
jgi:hypothetical protein